MVILSQSSGTLLDKLARGIGQTSDLILHSLASGYLKFNLTSLFIGTLNMDGLKASPIYLRPFVGVYCGLDLIRICTLPELMTFYFAYLQGRAVPEIKDCVSSWPVCRKYCSWNKTLLHLLPFDITRKTVRAIIPFIFKGQMWTIFPPCDSTVQNSCFSVRRHCFI